MNLQLPAVDLSAYRSQSQRSRVWTEAWASKELYCWACPSATLTAHAANYKVEDFHCPRCGRGSQLKARNGRHGEAVSNSSYAAKLAAIRGNRAPDYAFLGYDRDTARIHELFVVPGHFITEQVISARAPLRETAQRAGWVGSNIHLARIPPLGRLFLVLDEAAVRPAIVRKKFQATAFMARMPAAQRGWLADVLRCVERLGPRFRLADIYAFEEELQRQHPANLHIRDKLRQQLQVLRDQGLVRFVAPGQYEKVLPTSPWAA